MLAFNPPGITEVNKSCSIMEYDPINGRVSILYHKIKARSYWHRQNNGRWIITKYLDGDCTAWIPEKYSWQKPFHDPDCIRMSD